MPIVIWTRGLIPMRRRLSDSRRSIRNIRREPAGCSPWPIVSTTVVRSLNGKAIPEDSHKLYAMVAYIEWLSKDVPEGSRMGWRGIPRLAAVKSPNPSSGAKLYTARCAFCHGADGQGTMAAPPLWGRPCLQYRE